MNVLKVKQLIQKVDFINHTYTKYKWREHKKSYGSENGDKVFYVVRRAEAKVGLFSLVLTSLGQIQHAVEKGYIPVVDMHNYDKFYRGSNVETSNMWEYYFEQPCGYSMEKICKSKNVVLGNGIISDSLRYPGDDLAYDDEKLSYWKAIARKYLILKKEIAIEADNLAKEMFGKDKMLGVLARGTDYINAKPLNHPIQPMPEQLMEKIDHVLDERKCDRIYLATEDKIFFERFKSRYGDKIIAMNVERHISKGNENINDLRRAQHKDDYTMAREYLINILLLSKCNCLVAGNTSGSIGALLLNKEYEYKYIFNLGVYGKNGEY